MRPFENIRVLDLTHVLAGPFCTYQLAVLGADVIKIEPPHNPDMTRPEGADPALNADLMGTYFQGQNGGKRGLCLDLKTREGQDILKTLVKSADVLVENYRTGKLAALGLGYDDLSKLNDQLIYCSMTGYGQTGPKAAHPAYDVVIQAYSGIMAANATTPAGPVRVGPPMIDYGTGAQAALAVSAALFQREQTGKGQRIDVAMLDAALMMHACNVTGTVANGEPPIVQGNRHTDLAGYSAYDTADGLLMVGAYTNIQTVALFETLGLNSRADELAAMSREELFSQRETDEPVLEEVLKAKTADEWEALLNDAGVPAARVRGLDETLKTEQVQGRNGIQAVDGQGCQHLSCYPIAGFSYAHGSPSLDRPPPKLGEHSDDILMEAGFLPEDIAGLRQKGVI